MIKHVKIFIFCLLASCSAHPKIELESVSHFDSLNLDLSKLEIIMDTSKTRCLGIPYNMLYSNCYQILNEKGNYFELFSEDTITHKTNALIFQGLNSSRYIVNKQCNVIIDFTTNNLSLIKSLLRCNLSKRSFITTYNKPDSTFLNEFIYNNLIRTSNEGNYEQMNTKTFVYFIGDSVEKISVKKAVCSQLMEKKKQDVILVDSSEWINE